MPHFSVYNMVAINLLKCRQHNFFPLTGSKVVENDCMEINIVHCCFMKVHLRSAINFKFI